MKRAVHTLSIPQLSTIDEMKSEPDNTPEYLRKLKRDRTKRTFSVSIYVKLGVNILAAVACSLYGVIAGPVVLSVLNSGLCVIGWIGSRRDSERLMRFYFYATVFFAIIFSVLFSHLYTLHKVKSEAQGPLEDSYILFKYSVAGLRMAMSCFGLLSFVQLPPMFLAVNLLKFHSARGESETVRSVAAN